MAHSYRFANAELLPVQRQLLVDGTAARIGARAFDVLLALVERRDRVVTKAELLDLVWPGMVVEENNLAAQVSALRKVLGASAFATIPGIGYRFSTPLLDDHAAAPADVAGRNQTRRTNLPAATESLIGRDTDVAAVSSMLEQHRLVTIVGPGGIGKTRLAQEVARGLIGRFPHGAWWVDLAANPSAEAVVPAIAHAAELQLGAGDAAPELAQAFGDRVTLIVLDNSEYVAEHAATIVRTLLAQAPGVSILVTSQELLKVPTEFAYSLDGLAVAAADAAPEAARECAALRLLGRRASAADWRYRIADDKLPLALDLCRRLDGIALAIEMAAARLPVMGLETLVSRLGQRLDVLRSADRGAPERYRTMRATLEWSYSLLTDPQKRVLRRLASFAGSFRLDAAQRVGAGSGTDEWEVLDCLEGLVERSLVRVEQADPPRYRLLETTRLFAADLLAQHGETEEAVMAHATAMAALSDEIMRAFDQENEGQCVRRYAADYDDLRIAWDRAYARKDADMAGGVVMSLTRIDHARMVTVLLPDRKAAAFSLLDHGPGLLARARLWHCIAMQRFIPCPGILKLAAVEQAVAAWRAAGDRRYLFGALGQLAEALATAGQPQAGEIALSEMEALVPDQPRPARMEYHFYAVTVAAFGADMDLFKHRIEQQDRAARELGFDRFIALSAMQRTAWALSIDDIALALELGPIAMRLGASHGFVTVRANATLKYCMALLLSGQTSLVGPLLRECFPAAEPNVALLAWGFDPLALYAARIGDAAGAATFLGCADACYADVQEIRRPMDERIARLAEEEAARQVGGEAVARLRAEGARMRRAVALARVQETLHREVPGTRADGAPKAQAGAGRVLIQEAR